MIVIVLTGLPGTGKSTLAAALSSALDAPVLDKDRVREALFGPRFVTYTREQDDHCCDLLLAAADWLNRAGVVRCAILDGRTYSREGQVESLLRFATEHGLRLLFVRCVASDEEVHRRLEADRRAARHPARDRTSAKYLELKRDERPLPVPHLVLDTEALPLDLQVLRVQERLLHAGS